MNFSAQYIGFGAESDPAGRSISGSQRFGLIDPGYREGTVIESDDEEPILLDNRQLQITEFEQHLARVPGDTRAWLDYAHAHDDTREDQRAQLEVTMAILDRAGKAVFPSDRLPIILDELATAEKLYKPEEIEARWRQNLDEMERVLSHKPSTVGDMMKLWTAYLDWIEGLGFSRVGRTVEDAVLIHGNILMRLRRYGECEIHSAAVTNE
jgi:hypothetical protein